MLHQVSIALCAQIHCRGVTYGYNYYVNANYTKTYERTTEPRYYSWNINWGRRLIFKSKAYLRNLHVYSATYSSTTVKMLYFSQHFLILFQCGIFLNEGLQPVKYWTHNIEISIHGYLTCVPSVTNKKNVYILSI